MTSMTHFNNETVCHTEFLLLKVNRSATQFSKYLKWRDKILLNNLRNFTYGDGAYGNHVRLFLNFNAEDQNRIGYKSPLSLCNFTKL